MTAAVVAAVICLVLLLPVGVRIRYDGALAVQVAAGPVRLDVYPPRPPNYRKLARKQARARKKQAAQRPKRPKPPDKPRQKLSFGQLRALAGVGLRAAASLPRKLRVRTLQLRVVCGGADAAAAAVTYGRAWAAIGAALPVLENSFRLESHDLAAELDYGQPGTTWRGEADVRMRIGAGLLLALRTLAGALPILMQNKKKAVQEK